MRTKVSKCLDRRASGLVLDWVVGYKEESDANWFSHLKSAPPGLFCTISSSIGSLYLLNRDHLARKDTQAPFQKLKAYVDGGGTEKSPDYSFVFHNTTNDIRKKIECARKNVYLIPPDISTSLLHSYPDAFLPSTSDKSPLFKAELQLYGFSISQPGVKILVESISNILWAQDVLNSCGASIQDKYRINSFELNVYAMSYRSCKYMIFDDFIKKHSSCISSITVNVRQLSLI